MTFRPGIIFVAVFVMCIMMVVVLPLASAAAPVPQAVAEQPVVAAQAAVADAAALQVVVEQPTPAAEQQVVEQSMEQAQLPAEAAPVQQAAVSLPDDEQLRQFITTVQNGQAGVLVGVYVPGILSLPIVEQPGGDETYVSSEEGTVTRYALPGTAGVTALLAHNYLSGRDFIKMKQGQEIYLVYGDGQAARYRVAAVEFYQAHSPHDPHSNFTNLNEPGGVTMTYQDLYRRMYTTAGKLVFQTCLEANGDLSWGRTFVIAEPA